MILYLSIDLDGVFKHKNRLFETILYVPLIYILMISLLVK